MVETEILPNLFKQENINRLNPNQIITEKIFQSNKNEINKSKDINLNIKPKISLKYLSSTTKAVLSPSEQISENNDLSKSSSDNSQIKSPHIGLDILNEQITKLYAIEDLLVQLHSLQEELQKQQLLQQQSLLSIAPSLDQFSPDKINPSNPYPSYRSFLALKPKKDQKHTNQLYLEYLESMINMKLNSESKDNPLLPESISDKIQSVSIELLQNILTLSVETEIHMTDRYQTVGGVSYFETLLPFFKDIEGVNQKGNNKNPSKPVSTTEASFSTLISEWTSPNLVLDSKTEIKFKVGQIIQHKTWGYRGVCAGYHIRPVTDVSNWEGVKKSPNGHEQPFYRVSHILFYINFYYLFLLLLCCNRF